MATLPVWFLQAGQSEGSAVLVWVQPVGSRVTEKRLLTAQHVLRPSEDKRNGSYPSKIRAWPPDVGFLSDKRFDLELDLVLTPSDATPLVNAEDFAFLKIPPEATGATPSGLLTDAVCIVGLSDLNIVGYTNGQALIDLDGVVRPAPHPG